MAGDDTTAYALFLNSFHENVTHGNLFPIWEPNMNFGYGGPLLMYRQPLISYLLEFAYLITSNAFAAIALSQVLTVILASLGMYLLAKRLSALLFQNNQAARSWVIATTVAGYILSPYFLHDIYSRGALSETTCFAVYPWLTLALVRLAVKPNLRNISLGAIAYFCLVISHPGMHLMAAPFIIAAGYLFRNEIKSLSAFTGAIILGLMAGAYYWMPLILEQNYIKSALLTAPRNFYFSPRLCGLDALVSFPWHPARGGDWHFPGFLFLFGAGASLWLWAARKQPASGADLLRQRAIGSLLAFSAVCIYFMHPASELWYGTFPWLRMISFPFRFLAPLTFFSCLLGVIAGSMVFKRSWPCQILFVLIFIYGVQGVRRAEFSNHRVEEFTSDAIIHGGWRFEPHYSLPTTVPAQPMSPPARLVDVLDGAAELQCVRASPTLVTCRTASGAVPAQGEPGHL